jgi:hypothetical protein
MNPPLIITTLTVIVFFVGWLSIIHTSFLYCLIGFVLTAILPYILPKFNHLTYKELFKILITVWVFGVIHGYYWSVKAEWDAVGVFMLLSMLRYYGEMQMVNNYHHNELCWNSKDNNI